MDETLRHQRDTSLGQLDTLIRRGREIALTRSVDVTRAWQTDCAAAVNQLSGGSKAHWLSRAYSNAFMVRSADGSVVVEADATEIVERILGVLTQAAVSLSRMDDVTAASAGAPPRARRFDFVYNAGLRPVFEQAFDDSRAAIERGECALALILSCGLIDALLTDALESANRPSTRSTGSGRSDPSTGSGSSRAASRDEPVEGRNPQSAMSFDARIAAAERAGVIRGGCARLPPVARRYRELTDGDGALRPDVTVSEREARLAGQVLLVVMRDLDPSR